MLVGEVFNLDTQEGDGGHLTGISKWGIWVLGKKGGEENSLSLIDTNCEFVFISFRQTTHSNQKLKFFSLFTTGK